MRTRTPGLMVSVSPSNTVLRRRSPKPSGSVCSLAIAMDAPVLHSVTVPVAGSENSDRLLSGNSGHLPVALPGQTIVGDSVSGEGKDDRDAQATRDSSTPAGRPHVAGGG